MTADGSIDRREIRAGPSVEILPTETIKTAAELARSALREATGCWKEYQEAEEAAQKDRGDTEGTIDFTREPGWAGEGSWEITDTNLYSQYQYLKTNKEKLVISLQPGQSSHVYKSSISAKLTRTDGTLVEPPKNSRETLNLVIDFIKQIGGNVPPEFDQL